MIAGASIGLLTYFQIGYYVAALVSATVSLIVIVVVSYLDKGNFDFNSLSKSEPQA